MRVAVYVPLVLPLLAAISARWLAGRLPPRLATWLLTATAVGLAAASWAALSALAATAVGQLPLVAALGQWSAGALRADDPASVSVALVAAVLLTTALGAAVLAVRNRVRALWDAARRARRLPIDDTFDSLDSVRWDRFAPVVVVDDPCPDAYALPGLPGRIVVSTGMLAGLGPGEQRALLEHERAHLRCGHHVFVAVAALAAAANPLLRPVATAVGYATERWADERAATALGDRRTVAHAIAGAAVLLTNHTGRGRPQGALAIAPGTHAVARTRAAITLWRAGPVPRRVAALLAGPPQRARLALVVVVTLLIIATAASIETARDLETLFELARLGN